MSIRHTFADRWRFDDVPRLRPIRAALDRALDLHDQIREEHGKIAGNANLSALGRQDAMRKYVAGRAPDVRRALQTISRFRGHLDAWRARLEPRRGDTNQLRGEMRTFLRAMKSHERIKFLMGKQIDPDFHVAAVEVPNALSGIDDELRAYIVEQVIERMHPGQLAQLEQAHEAVDILDAATRVTLGTVRAAADFPDFKSFSDFVDGAIGAKAPAIDEAVSRELEPA